MELIANNCSEQIGTKILEGLEPKLKNEIEALLTIPKDVGWVTENYENPLDRVFAAMEEASIRSTQIVQLLLNSKKIQSFQKTAEAKLGDVPGQQKERGTYTNADILAQLCVEISVMRLNHCLESKNPKSIFQKLFQVMNKLVQGGDQNLNLIQYQYILVALNSEEEVGELTKTLKPIRNTGQIIVAVDPVDGTVYLKEGEKQQPNIRWYSTAFASTDERGNIFGQVHIPDKNLTIRQRPNGKWEIVKYLGTPNEVIITTDLDKPTQTVCINGRVPQSIQNIISNNKEQKIEREKDEPEDEIGWRANGSAVAFLNGEYGVYAVTGKELRDKVILELLAQDTDRFTSFRINLKNEKGIEEETLVVINKQMEGYNDIILQLNNLKPIQQELKETRSNLK